MPFGTLREKARNVLIASDTRLDSKTSSFGGSHVCHSCFDPYETFGPLYLLKKTLPTDPTFPGVPPFFYSRLLSEDDSELLADQVALRVPPALCDAVSVDVLHLFSLVQGFR